MCRGLNSCTPRQQTGMPFWVKSNSSCRIDPSALTCFQHVVLVWWLQSDVAMVRTRLDTVVEVKERLEDRAVEALARAESAVSAAQRRADEARQLAQKDFRSRASLEQWEVMELAHHRAVGDAKKAEKELAALQKSAEKVREAYVKAHQQAEVVRRVAESRRSELLLEMNRSEDKLLDEAASLLFVRKAG
jgi:flagellar export protein FliJ